MRQNRTGRPRQWHRPRIMLRAELPEDLVDALRSDADRQGKSATEVLGEILSGHYGIPYTKGDPEKPQNQETLPIGA